MWKEYREDVDTETRSISRWKKKDIHYIDKGVYFIKLLQKCA